MKQKAEQTSIAGQQAEQAASLFLQQQGYTLLDQNYRFKGGEIDLILRNNKRLLFAEVRMRNNPHYGDGAESVTYAKQRRISRTALHYLQRHPQFDAYDLRFDVLSATHDGQQYQFNWFKEAFWPGDN
ncbi:MAG: YraN family protein [Gammaproteobacteria bacterium]|nr:YraN family protein [Gammaproteobacteria bacterium]MBT5745687.1 YraN family protein [Gammaproteobacteria bacterium]MBT6670912.1 YraN family protein [Gammaproteobacteria bacterium]MBT7022319.1 YraN family protein [Gammaproteobacteria bacterium]MBT7231158.1 YraN family protein [Gammaproteobacteria bacterium]